MKVFVSWSGGKSHRIALALHNWLPRVLQNIKPYISSEDIWIGMRWNVEVARALEDCSYGIICVTRENMNSPWLNFEAGAISRHVRSSHVSPILIDLKPADLVSPLSQFQMISLRFEDIIRLVHSINSACNDPLGEALVADSLEVWRPNLVRDIEDATRQELESPKEPQRQAPDMIKELVEMVRDMQRRMLSAQLEAQNREAPDELARRHVRTALSQFRDSNAQLVDISPTAMTVTFREQPEPQLMSLIESIANLHGMTLYTNVSNP